jgi:hypothetical protein
MTIQLQFQLWEEVEITWSYIWAVGRMWKYGIFFSPEIPELQAQCERARCRGEAPSRLQCPFRLAGPVFEVIPRHLCRRLD